MGLCLTPALTSLGLNHWFHNQVISLKLCYINSEVIIQVTAKKKIIKTAYKFIQGVATFTIHNYHGPSSFQKQRAWTKTREACGLGTYWHTLNTALNCYSSLCPLCSAHWKFKNVISLNNFTHFVHKWIGSSCCPVWSTSCHHHHISRRTSTTGHQPPP